MTTLWFAVVFVAGFYGGVLVMALARMAAQDEQYSE